MRDCVSSVKIVLPYMLSPGQLEGNYIKEDNVVILKGT